MKTKLFSLIGILGITLMSLGLFGCSNTTAPDDGVITDLIDFQMGGDKLDTWDGFNMEVSTTPLGGGHYEYEVVLSLKYASERAFGINLPVKFDEDNVYYYGNNKGSIYSCQEDSLDQFAVFFINGDTPLHAGVSMTSHLIWPASQEDMEEDRWRCDWAPDNVFVHIFYRTLNTNIGTFAKFKFACDIGVSPQFQEERVKSRNCANGELDFKIYYEGLEDTQYENNCDLDEGGSGQPCEYDPPLW